MMSDISTAIDRVQKYIGEYEDAPNWGGPTIYPKAPRIIDLKLLVRTAREALTTRLAPDRTDAEIERILSLTDEQVLAECSPDELRKARLMRQAIRDALTAATAPDRSERTPYKLLVQRREDCGGEHREWFEEHPIPDALVQQIIADAAVEEVPCEVCQGNGELVTDWERYRHPRDGDKGDEAVVDCSTCFGRGVVNKAPARESIVRLIVDFLYGQRETPEELADAILKLIKGEGLSA